MPGDAYDIEPEPELHVDDRAIVGESVACVTCGAPLSGKRTDGVCECGTTVEYSRFGIEGGDGQAPVVGEMPCSRCGYNLDGLKPEEQCPECGLSIQRSLMGNALANSDPGYVATLASGALIAEWTVILNLLIIVGSVYVGAFMRMPGTFAMVGVLSILLNVASLGGWWMLTTPDPALGAHNPGHTARTVLRATLVLMILVGGSNLLGSRLQSGPMLPGGMVPVSALFSLLLPVVWIVKLYSSMSYLAAIEGRVRSSELGTLIHSARTSLNWSIGTFLGMILFAMVAPCAALPAFVALAIYLVILLIRYVAMLDALRVALNVARLQAASS